MNPNHMQVDPSLYFYFGQIITSSAAPVLRFLEGFVEQPEAREKLQFFGSHKIAFKDNECSHIDDFTWQRLLRFKALRRIGIVDDDGRYDTWHRYDLCARVSFEDHVHCKTIDSKMYPPPVFNERTKERGLFMMCLDLHSAAGRGTRMSRELWSNEKEQGDDLPKLAMMDLWRMLPCELGLKKAA
jgi:hypothetical protein